MKERKFCDRNGVQIGEGNIVIHLETVNRGRMTSKIGIVNDCGENDEGDEYITISFASQYATDGFANITFYDFSKFIVLNKEYLEGIYPYLLESEVRPLQEYKGTDEKNSN
jgi:hypothetical protein